jgi:putative transposase
MAGGTHAQEILQEVQDRQRFLETLGEACAKTGFRIHACVLMGNYYHLLLQTPEGNLVAGMKVMDCGNVCGGAAAIGE